MSARLIEGSIYTAIEQEDGKTTCPNGHSANMVLLITITMSRLPAFYICHACGYIGEVGVGKVTPGGVMSRTDDELREAVNRHMRANLFTWDTAAGLVVDCLDDFYARPMSERVPLTMGARDLIEGERGIAFQVVLLVALLRSFKLYTLGVIRI